MTFVVGREHQHIFYDRHLPPAARIGLGELVTIQTTDACYGACESLRPGDPGPPQDAAEKEEQHATSIDRLGVLDDSGGGSGWWARR